MACSIDAKLSNKFNVNSKVFLYDVIEFCGASHKIHIKHHLGLQKMDINGPTHRLVYFKRYKLPTLFTVFFKFVVVYFCLLMCCSLHRDW